MAISGNPRKSLPKGVRVVNLRNHGAFVLQADGVHPANPDTAHIPLERGGVVYSRQGAKIELPLGGLSATKLVAALPKTTTIPTTTIPIATLSPKPAASIPKAADYVVPRYIPTSIPAPVPTFTSTRPTTTRPPEPSSPAPAPAPEPSLSPTSSPATPAEQYYSPSEQYEYAASSAEASGGGATVGARQRPSTGTEEEMIEAEAPRPMSLQKKAVIAGGVLGFGFLVRKWLKSK